MTVYICLSEEGVRQTRARGFDAQRDVLVLAHDAVYSTESGAHVRVCRDDLRVRGLPGSDGHIDDNALMKLILENDRIVVA